MSARDTVAGLADWKQEIDKAIASLKRGDGLRGGTTQIASVALGKTLKMEDASVATNGKHVGLAITDMISGVRHIIPIPMPDPTQLPPLGLYEVPFTLADQLFVSSSPPYSPKLGARLTGAIFHLGTAGTSDTHLNIVWDVFGYAGPDIVIPAGQVQLTMSWPVPLIVFDSPPTAVRQTVRVAVLTAGTGAADLTAQLWFT